MKFLDQSVAQEIVNRTMSIIKRNINVMNDQGVIIGSGDKKRIHTIHEGAVRVIEARAGNEITELQAQQLQGVKAGINLPIFFHDKVVGVVGITGPPEEVRSYGELLQMTAEMILQQAVLLDEMQWDERLKEELISQLLHGTKNLNALYFERVKRLGIDLDTPRVAVIFMPDNQSRGFKWIRDKREKDDLLVMHADHIVLLKKAIVKDSDWEPSHTVNQVEKWVAGWNKNQRLHCKAAIGGYHPGFEGISESYREALHTLHAGGKLDRNKAVYQYEEYKLPIFLARANQMGIGGELGPYYKRLEQQDRQGELLETLRMYIEENGDVNQTAGRLFIHRNTLRYRLERIADITGKDPKKVKDLLELYLSILQHQMQ